MSDRRHSHPLRGNAVDRLIGYFAPDRALKRIASRAALNRISAYAGAYTGADASRRALRHWHRRTGDANADTLQDLPNLRRNSRDLLRNICMATGAINRTVTNVVGPGLMVMPQIDRDFLGLSEEEATAWQQAARREFNLWAENVFCDATECQSFRGLQDLVMRSTLESGDVFTLSIAVDRADWPYETAIQLYEADQISNPDLAGDGATLNGNTLFGGIEVNDRGAGVAVHVRNRHPGGFAGRGPVKWRRVPVFAEGSGNRQIKQHFNKLRPGHTRGVPFLAPVVEQLKQLGTYSEAELFAAVIGAMITVVHKGEPAEALPNPDPSAAPEGVDEVMEYEMGPGTVLDLKREDSIEVPELGRPNSGFDPFFVAIMRQIGAALEIPFELLIMHFTASYSASRAALEVAFQFFRRRRKWLIESFCEWAYELVIAEAVARGRLVAPGFFGDPLVRQAWLGADWIGAPRVSIDPERENKADIIAEDRGWKTAAEITAEKTGGDWERKLSQRDREQKLRRAAGLASSGSQAPAPPEPDRNDQPDDPPEEDD